MRHAPLPEAPSPSSPSAASSARLRGQLAACASRAASVVLLTLALAASSVAQEEQEKLIIGTKEAAPFSFRVDDGPWQGISIDLWTGIARDLGLA